MPLSEPKVRRLVVALAATIDNWCSQIEEIHEHATPGNKVRALHLHKSLLQAKQSIETLIRDAEAG